MATLVSRSIGPWEQTLGSVAEGLRVELTDNESGQMLIIRVSCEYEGRTLGAMRMVDHFLLSRVTYDMKEAEIEAACRKLVTAIAERVAENERWQDNGEPY